MWQQLIFAGGAISFAIALWPSIRSQNKPDIKTSILTAFWLTLYLVAYISLHFWFAVVCEVLCVIGWWTLAWQMKKDWRTLPFIRNKVTQLHVADCPMTNKGSKYRTTCVCKHWDTPQVYLEGGGGRMVI